LVIDWPFSFSTVVRVIRAVSGRFSAALSGTLTLDQYVVAHMYCVSHMMYWHTKGLLETKLDVCTKETFEAKVDVTRTKARTGLRKDVNMSEQDST
jgi:hypothetical protein